MSPEQPNTEQPNTEQPDTGPAAGLTYNPNGICAGRVVIVTGAGRGLGRAHALAFAAEGAKVVVNDYGVDANGQQLAETPADDVVAEIKAMGGEAVSNNADVADWGHALDLIEQAVETYGALDTLVNNAGFLRDRMLVSMSEQEWDAVMRVHLKGHFAPLHHAANYWRTESKAGRPRKARVVQTSSGAGLLGSVGQGNYSAAKAGIATLSAVAAAEMGGYGVAVNTIAPSARTRMTEAVFADTMNTEGQDFDAMAPENVSPLVVWLGSDASGHVTGRTFEVEAGKISVADSWHHGPEKDKGARWQPAEVGAAVDELLGQIRKPEPVYGAR